MKKLGLIALLILSLASPAFARQMKAGLAVPVAAQGQNIASAVRGPGFNGAALNGGGSTNTQNLESYHVNESGAPVCSFALIYSGWYTDVTSETDNPNPYTVGAAVDYPAGTYTQEKWQGATTDLIAPGANITGDTEPLATCIPAGATFGVRTFVSVSTSGFNWPSSGGLWGSEVGEVGTGLANKTMSGATITGTAAGLRPSAILSVNPGTFVHANGACLGDSIMAGAGDSGFDSHGNIGYCGRAFSGTAPVIQIAVTGTTLVSQVATNKFLRRPDLLKKAGVSHAIYDWAVNDMRAGSAVLSTLESQVNTIATATNNAGAKTIWTTTTPCVSGTNTQNYYTVASQTVCPTTPNAAFTGGSSSLRAQFNAWLRGTPSPLFAYIETAWAEESAHDSGFFGAGSGQSIYLAPIDNLTVASGSTTTVINTNATRAANYYNGGGFLFTGGVDNGGYSLITAFASGGAFTAQTAFSSAPAAGDSVTAFTYGAAETNDGLHPNNSGNGYGGTIVLMNVLLPTVQYWNTH